MSNLVSIDLSHISICPRLKLVRLETGMIPILGRIIYEIDGVVQEMGLRVDLDKCKPDFLCVFDEIPGHPDLNQELRKPAVANSILNAVWKAFGWLHQIP